MRAVQVIFAVVVMGGTVSAGAQSNNSVPTASPVLAAPLAQAPPPPPPAGKSRSPIPAGNPGAWATTADYPSRALREGREGITGFRLTVGPDGRPTGCMVTSSSGSPDLDAVTCELVSRRALFKPALDAKGKPTQGTYSSRVRWLIPRKSMAIEPSDRTMTFIVEIDGTSTNCAETLDGKPVAALTMRNPCAPGTTMKPFTDAAGKPVRKQVVVTQTVTVSDAPN